MFPNLSMTLFPRLYIVVWPFKLFFMASMHEEISRFIATRTGFSMVGHSTHTQ